ncbi:DNA (cytosine-5)-methyltransferase 1 [Halanaerobium sp. DL-01]|uniref:DNA cytosine methyltransferase n=1 Tax=Halanaerobium sp. DL-01 TaxID=1653064 RepID=UPI000DF22C71|nr:DNA cytosine methyltransferase [Halanaerobium sp. DL-01]RCW81652.1 DNA (cytosine-5)-methyltransferase 1 [Halanaerobium sp. DL-01]
MLAYKGISLFSGCGGLDLGFEKVNDYLNNEGNSIFEIIWANDINNAAVQTYSENFGFDIYENPKEEISKKRKKIFLGDVKNIDFKNEIEDDIDFVLGGFPCQDFSILGGSKRQGIKVKRGSLYLQFVRSLIELQPLFFVAENVKGIKSANNGAAFKQIKNDFQHLNENLVELSEKTKINLSDVDKIENYKILFDDVVNFADFGVPQNRERMIFIGIRSDLIDSSEEKTIKNKLRKFLLPEKSFPVTPLEVFEGEVLENLNQKYIGIMGEFKEYLEKMKHDYAEEFKNNTWLDYALDITEDYKNLNDVDYNKNERTQAIYNALKEIGAYKNPISKLAFEDDSNKRAATQERIKERMRRIPPGQNHEFVRDTKYSVKAMMSNIYRRVHPLVPSPTIIANGGGGTYGYHYERERQNLTNRERARLQSFPDNFLFNGNKSDVRRQIGNSVPPLGSKRVAQAVKDIVLEVIESKLMIKAV